MGPRYRRPGARWKVLVPLSTLFGSSLSRVGGSAAGALAWRSPEDCCPPETRRCRTPCHASRMNLRAGRCSALELGESDALVTLRGRLAPRLGIREEAEAAGDLLCVNRCAI